VADEIVAAGGRAAPFVANSASPEDNEKTVAFAAQTFGRLNYAGNNAGIGGKAAPAGEVDIANWNRVIDINLNGVLYGMRYQIPAMLKAGAGESAIVKMASIHGAVAAIGNGAYTAAKHGVVGLTKNAAAEYGSQGLRINCVGPAYIETPLLANLPDDFRAQLIGRHPLGVSAGPKRSQRWFGSCCPTTPHSSQAATTWWTGGTRRSERGEHQSRDWPVPAVTTPNCSRPASARR
jgi:NAD(P)-dependent dehydrogenase (short-subunit alcohol dehydrogenase family)